MNSLTLLVRGMVGLIAAIGFGVLWKIASRPRNFWIPVIIGIAAGVAAFVGTLGLQLVSSRPVIVNIDSPVPRTEIDGAMTVITGTISPADARVMVLVHPWNADRWWVQKTPMIVSVDEKNGSALWQAEIRLGSKESGAGQAFEVIVLGSQGPLLFDILAQRYFREADELTSLPLLSHSIPLVLFRKDR